MSLKSFYLLYNCNVFYSKLLQQIFFVVKFIHHAILPLHCIINILATLPIEKRRQVSQLNKETEHSWNLFNKLFYIKSYRT